jgi:hypothetical protein
MGTQEAVISQNTGHDSISAFPAQEQNGILINSQLLTALSMPEPTSSSEVIAHGEAVIQKAAELQKEGRVSPESRRYLEALASRVLALILLILVAAPLLFIPTVDAQNAGGTGNQPQVSLLEASLLDLQSFLDAAPPGIERDPETKAILHDAEKMRFLLYNDLTFTAPDDENSDELRHSAGNAGEGDPEQEAGTEGPPLLDYEITEPTEVTSGPGSGETLGKVYTGSIFKTTGIVAGGYLMGTGTGRTGLPVSGWIPENTAELRSVQIAEVSTSVAQPLTDEYGLFAEQRASLDSLGLKYGSEATYNTETGETTWLLSTDGVHNRLVSYWGDVIDYSFDQQGWVEDGARSMWALMPGGNPEMLKLYMEANSGSFDGWDSEYKMYRVISADGEVLHFMPRAGFAPKSGNATEIDASNLREGLVRCGKKFASRNFKPGESGNEYAVCIPVSHPLIQRFTWENRYPAEDIRDGLDYLATLPNGNNGQTHIVSYLPERPASQLNGDNGWSTKVYIGTLQRSDYPLDGNSNVMFHGVTYASELAPTANDGGAFIDYNIVAIAAGTTLNPDSGVTNDLQIKMGEAILPLTVPAFQSGNPVEAK